MIAPKDSGVKPRRGAGRPTKTERCGRDEVRHRRSGDREQNQDPDLPGPEIGCKSSLSGTTVSGCDRTHNSEIH